MKVGDKSGITQKPVRKSGRFDGRIVPGIFIGDCIVIRKDAIFLVGERGRKHVGGQVVSSVDAASEIVCAVGFFIGEAVKAVRVRGGVDEVILIREIKIFDDLLE